MLDRVMYICMCERKGGIILKYCCDFNLSSVSISNNLYISGKYMPDGNKIYKFAAE